MTVSSKIRIYDLAKELRLDTKRLIEELRSQGVQVSVPSNSISKTLAQTIRANYPHNKPIGPRPKKRTRSVPDRDYSNIMRPTQICHLCGLSCGSRPALNMHLLENHSSNLKAGELLRHFSVSELAIGLSVNTGRIREAARRLGHEFAAELDVIEPDFLPKILVDLEAYQANLTVICHKLGSDVFSAIETKTFRELRELIDACLREASFNRDDEELATNDKQKLLLYVRMLELKAYDEQNANVDFRKRVITRIIDAIEALETRKTILAAKRLPWKLLPSGKLSFQHILNHFQSLSRHRTLVEYNINRLRQIHNLRPDEIYVGEAEFDGYVVFYFRDGPAALLECPVVGNATYVFGDNWKQLSRRTKTDLLNSVRLDFDRVIHKDGWLSRLKFVITKRGVRLSSRRLSSS